jgi:hypothetical protein
LEDPGVDRRILLKNGSSRGCIGGTQTGSIWLRFGTGGGAVVNAVMKLEFHKMWEI